MKIIRFTLVELIAAMAVLAVIGSASAAALFGFQRSHDKVVNLSKQLERNRKLDKLADLMSNMQPTFFWRDEEENNGERLVFDGRSDELWFTSMRLPDAQGQGALVFVRLYVDDENNLVCDTKNTPLLPWVEMEKQQTGVTSSILAEKVAAIKFIYGEYDDNDQIDWLDHWDQDDEEYEDRLPAAVGFTVEFENGEKLSYLRRTAGLSAFTGLAL